MCQIHLFALKMKFLWFSIVGFLLGPFYISSFVYNRPNTTKYSWQISVFMSNLVSFGPGQTLNGVEKHSGISRSTASRSIRYSSNAENGVNSFTLHKTFNNMVAINGWGVFMHLSEFKFSLVHLYLLPYLLPPTIWKLSAILLLIFLLGVTFFDRRSKWWASRLLENANIPNWWI